MTARERTGFRSRPAAMVRQLAARMVPGLGWTRKWLPHEGAAGRRPRRRLTHAQQEQVLREWKVLRERLSGIARARLADVGDLLREAELRFAPEHAEKAAQHDYLWAMEAYEAAGKLLDEAADLPDLAAAVVLADRALERFAAAHARHEGRRPAAPAVRCFYNPLHAPAAGGPSKPGGARGGRTRGGGSPRKARRISPRQAAADRRPACEPCRLAILAGQMPDVLPALLPVRVSRLHTVRILVPYYAVPQADSLWSATACGAYDEEAPAAVLRGEHRRRTTRPRGRG